MFMSVRALMTAAPPSSSMEVTKMFVRMQKKKNVRWAALPQRASAQQSIRSQHRIMSEITFRTSLPHPHECGTSPTSGRHAALLNAPTAVAWLAGWGLTDNLQHSVCCGCLALYLDGEDAKQQNLDGCSSSVPFTTQHDLQYAPTALLQRHVCADS